jgi:hypothetical protein
MPRANTERNSSAEASPAVWRRKRYRAIAFALLAAALLGSAPGTATETDPPVAPLVRFSALRAGDPPPPPWRLQTYAKVPRHTEFALVDDDGTTVLQARAEGAAASLIRPYTADAGTTPWLAWRWKPLSAPAKSALRDKGADDWGARLYLLFEPPPEALGFGERLALKIARTIYGDDLPARGLCYVWLPGGKPGEIAPNAYTDRLHMIVVDVSPPGEWRTIVRNVADDYRAAFGEPPPPISALAVSADSDNGGGRAEVRFGDLGFSAIGGRKP